MSDDIFSQLFNLFNNDDGDVNWNLASQINNHINKESEDSFLFSNSEMNYEEIFRAIQLNNQSLDIPYEDIENLQILNSKEYGNWFLDSVKHFDFSNLNIANSSPFNLAGAQSSLIGMQLGNISGFLSKNTWGLSHFGVILPRNSSLAINKNNFDLRISQFSIDEKEATIALMLLEYIALTLGEHTAPFNYLIEQLNKSNKELLENIKNIEPNFDPSNFSNPEDLMRNIPELNDFDVDSMLDVIFAPLSFYRSVIKYQAKNLIDFIDPSVIDPVSYTHLRAHET